MDVYAKLLLAFLFIIGGLGYVALRIAVAIQPDSDPLGWGPVLTGVAVAAVGVLLIIL